MGLAFADGHLCPDIGEEAYDAGTENARDFHCHRLENGYVKSVVLKWDSHKTLLLKFMCSKLVYVSALRKIF